MNLNRIQSWLGTFAACVGLSLSVTAQAQDFGSLQGNPARTGNAVGGVNNSGRTLLTWYRPIQTDAYGRTLIRNNTSPAVTTTGTWLTPSIMDEASGSYFPVPATPTTDPVNVAENILRGIVSSTLLQPAYSYAFTVPSAGGTNHPLTQNFGADTLSVFEWTVEPPAVVPNQRFPRNYALSAWVPIGPTGDGAGGLIYPQRYYVYEIIDSLGVSSVDVVDTYQGGFGWIRLGGGGRPTNRLFFYDGVSPIRIRLYNTVPRWNERVNDVVNVPLADWTTVFSSVPYSTVVYADAVKADPSNGTYTSTPIVSSLDPANLGAAIQSYDARNTYTTAVLNGNPVTLTQAEITARNYQTGNTVWTYRPIAESQYTTNVDSPSAMVVPTAPWAATTAEPNFLGPDYFLAPITSTPGTEQAVTYSPDLADGSYEILVYVPGSRGAETLGQEVVYRVEESGQPPVDVTIDQDAARGWVSLGNRRWNHTEADPLVVRVTNLSTLPSDAGKSAYADAIRFVGAANLGIHSTLVNARALVRTTNGGVPVETSVVVGATEDGKLICMDATGNGDGTTNVYWTYPSTPDPNNPSWTDPNQVAGEDGVGGIAQMSNGWDLSSALIANIGGSDYLIIAARNGRVYCIDMAGRGDMNLGTRQPGTTTRVWTYPDDYPAASRPTSLGAFSGSIAYANTTVGPTVFIAAPQGRIYAINPLPGPNKTASLRWVWPPLNQPTLGEISMTPLYHDGRLFFGTKVKDGDDRGRFYCLDDNGNFQWEFNGTGTWLADDFVAGPALGLAANLNPGVGDTIFVINENRHVVALRANDGFLQWDTDELAAGAVSNLTFTLMDVYDGLGATAIAPVVVVPTADGRFRALFANPGTGFGATNRFGTKVAWGYNAAGGLISGVSAGRGFLYGADDAGFMYAFAQTGNGAGGDIDGPGSTEIVPNNTDPNIEPFRNAKIRFVTKDTYQRLRYPSGDANMLTYAQATDPAREVTDVAFDWGQTLYVMVYDFPYQDTYAVGALAGTPAPPPIVTYLFSVEGAYQRNISIESRRFNGNTNPDGREGFAIFPYAIQGGGSNALPPGNGLVKFSINTTAVTDPPQNISIGDFFSTPGPNQRSFRIANPIGIIAKSSVTQLFEVGNIFDPNHAENLVNGNPDLAATPGKNEARLTAEFGLNSHNQGAISMIGLVDRSLMTLLRGPGLGLDNVRVTRSDLVWQGGKAAVINPVDSIPYYAAFFGTGKDLEDYPVNFPNTSLDYPNIAGERVSVVKDPNGSAANPVFNNISLFPVTNVNEAVSPITRTLNPTPTQITVNIPRFQPANYSTWINSGGESVAGGYVGTMNVFVDSDGNGTLTTNRGRREAYRRLNLSTGVAADSAISVLQPTIDFGTLAGSTGYDPAPPGTGSFSPWSGAWDNIWKPITIRNEGNQNELAIRLAKGYGDGVTVNPWQIFAAGQDRQAWINGVLNLHATFDSNFQLVGPTAAPILLKARPGDLSPSVFRDNPPVRQNSNLGVTAQPLLAGPDPESPRIALTVPLGMPSSAYEWIIRVISDVGNDESNLTDINGTSLETAAELQIKAKVRETRYTTSTTPNTAPHVDNLITTNSENFFHSNRQPTGMRTSGGHLVMVFTSDRISAPIGADFDKALPTTQIPEKNTRLYVTGIVGTTPTSLPNSDVNSRHPLNDLNRFVGDTNRWARRTVSEYPNTPLNTLFPGDPVIASTAQFGAASLPVDGDINPLTGATQNQIYMAFVGNVQKQSGSQRYMDSRIFVGTLQATTGNPTLSAPNGLPYDTENVKGRPTIAQAGRSALIMYPVLGTGQSQIAYTVYDGNNFTQPRYLDTGSGFESVGSPSLTLRNFNGTGQAAGPIAEFTFVGKLAGRPAAEVFIGRMTVNNNLNPGAMRDVVQRTNERLVAESEVGQYRSEGVRWNTGATITLSYALNGDVATAANIEVPNTRKVDRTTGIISFDTTLGGRAVLNPNTGVVRLTNTLPNRSGALFLTYTARYLRISQSSGQYRSAQMLFDTRLSSDNGFYFRNDNTPAVGSDQTRPFRSIFTYVRGTGDGNTTRPYMQTLRFGIQLPYAIYTDQDGNIPGLTIVGATSFYQVDPANGRIYFADVDEGRNVRVVYNAIDEGTGNPIPQAAATYRIGYVTERSEAPVSIDQAVNESETWFTLDPFELANNNARRPGLIWNFWTSTRTGTTDIFYQTLAPRFTPIARN